MKKLIGIILLVVLVFVGCDLGSGNTDNNNTNNGDNNTNNETITIDNLSIKTTGVKSLKPFTVIVIY
jgi:hypothetical protein